MGKQNALDAVEATRDLYQAAWAKLGKVIARKKFIGLSYDVEQRRRASVSRKISIYNSLLLNLTAAQSVVGAPSPARVQDIKNLVDRVSNIAVADALTAEGLHFISTALSTAKDTVSGIEMS